MKFAALCLTVFIALILGITITKNATYGGDRRAPLTTVTLAPDQADPGCGFVVIRLGAGGPRSVQDNGLC